MPFRQQFTLKERDIETGLDYFLAQTREWNERAKIKTNSVLFQFRDLLARLVSGCRSPDSSQRC